MSILFNIARSFNEIWNAPRHFCYRFASNSITWGQPMILFGSLAFIGPFWRKKKGFKLPQLQLPTETQLIVHNLLVLQILFFVFQTTLEYFDDKRHLECWIAMFGSKQLKNVVSPVFDTHLFFVFRLFRAFALMSYRLVIGVKK